MDFQNRFHSNVEEISLAEDRNIRLDFVNRALCRLSIVLNGYSDRAKLGNG